MALCLLFLEDKRERDKRKGGTVENVGWDREGRERERRNFMTCVQDALTAHIPDGDIAHFHVRAGAARTCRYVL